VQSNKGFVQFTLAIVVTCTTYGAFAEDVQFSDTRITTIEHRSFEKVKLIFDVRPRQTISEKEFDAYMGTAVVFFALGTAEERAISSVQLEWGGMPPIYLAESAFVDLHSPSVTRITQKGIFRLLTIEGGDAGSSYVATLEIAPYGVVSRRVFNRISGYEQVTTYTHPASSIDFVMKSLEEIRKKKFQK
jgi:hypothetical protein